MIIEIHRPELQAILMERINKGDDLEDVILGALQASPADQHLNDKPRRPRPAGRRSLAQLFADSPFKGLDIEFERGSDAARKTG